MKMLIEVQFRKTHMPNFEAYNNLYFIRLVHDWENKTATFQNDNFCWS